MRDHPPKNSEATILHDEPCLDVAHLGHVELLTPTPEDSLAFFTGVMGMTESGRHGDSVLLRGWDDYERCSLVLTASNTSGLGHAAFRVRSPQALARRVAALEREGAGIGWVEGVGHGPGYRFRDPDGHELEIYYETERYQAPAALRPALKNQAQRYPARGCNVRRIDHFNCLAVDVRANREFFERALGFRLTERIVLDSGEEAGMWLTATNKSYDFAYTKEAHGVRGRFHHVTFALDSREDILRAADVFLEAGVPIETGPHKHAVQQTFFLYVFEPGGNRVEVANAGARLILAPDHAPVTWTETERKKGQAWGLKTIASFHTRGTPPLPADADEGAHAGAENLAEKGIAIVSGTTGKTALVVSAHSADFVWRAGGAIALHAQKGFEVTVICLSYGERGESAKLWRQPGMTIDRVKASRQDEAKAAAAHLGVQNIEFWDLGDYPITLDQTALFRMVDVFRAIRPAFMLTHSERDIYNHDHPAVTDFARHARIIAQAHGHKPETKVIGAPPVFLFEPHQPEQCDWKPDVLLDISSVWAKKRAAIECMAGQEHLWDYYTRVAQQRGAQAARNSDKSIAWGEGYVAVYPHVVESLA